MHSSPDSSCPEESTVNGIHFKIGDRIEYQVALYRNKKLRGVIVHFSPGGQHAQATDESKDNTGPQISYWSVDLMKVKKL